MAKGIVEAMGRGPNYYRGLIQEHLASDATRERYIDQRKSLVRENIRDTARFIRSLVPDTSLRAPTEELATMLHAVLTRDLLPLEVLSMDCSQALGLLDKMPFMFIPGRYRQVPAFGEFMGGLYNLSGMLDEDGQVERKPDKGRPYVVFAHWQMIKPLVRELNRKVDRLLASADHMTMEEVDDSRRNRRSVNEKTLDTIRDEKVGTIYWYQLMRIGIHPYVDYNGRVVRALAATMLKVHGLVQAYERVISRFEEGVTREDLVDRPVDADLIEIIRDATIGLLGAPVWLESLDELNAPLGSPDYQKIFPQIHDAILREISTATLESISKNPFMEAVMDNLKTVPPSDEPRIGGDDFTLAMVASVWGKSGEGRGDG